MAEVARRNMYGTKENYLHDPRIIISGYRSIYSCFQQHFLVIQLLADNMVMTKIAILTYFFEHIFENNQCCPS